MNGHIQPPRVLLAIIRYAIHPDFREEIEGDLTEQYHANILSKGKTAATVNMVAEIVCLMKPRLLNLPLKNNHIMNKKQVIIMLLLCVVILLMTALPYIQGRFSRPAVVLSTAVQVLGFISTILIPVGVLGISIPKSGNSSWYKVVTVMAVLFYVSILILLAIRGDSKALIISTTMGLLLLLPFYFYRKNTKLIAHRTLFLYCIFLPLVAMFGRRYMAVQLATQSRNNTIQLAGKWVTSIEDHKAKHGEYPQKITDIKNELPEPAYIGIKSIVYERISGGYHLQFTQWVDMGAAQEVVVYSKNGNYYRKGHIASFDTGIPGWKYYWYD
ncbi:MAG: hypothetical protein KF862_25260 [Chitinophagaceae bacterium]|nr:hypothetical protein [Chitinophagaceae bacterium]